MSRWTLLLGLLIGAILLGFSLENTNLTHAMTALRRLDWTLLILALTILLASYGAKAQRWHLLLQPIKSLRWQQLYFPVCVGAAGNGLLPHAGELLRAALLHRRQRLAYSATLASIAIERMFDFMAIAVLTVVVLPASTGEAIHTAFQFIGLAFGVLLLTFMAAVLWPERCKKAGSRLLRWAPANWRAPLHLELDAGIGALSVLRQHRQLPAVIGWSLVQWLLIGLVLYLCVAAIGVHITAANAMGVLLLTVAGLTLPTAPGYLGTLQACFLIGLTGVASPAEAFAASVVYNLTVTLLPTAIAFPALLKFSRLKRELKTD